MIVVISGTPGCGKTKVAKELAKKLKFRYLDLNKAIKTEKLYSGYDRKRKTYIADMLKVKRYTNKILKGDWIVDSHLSHFIKNNVVIVLRCEPKILEQRLKRKRWNKNKIKENVEAEMISLITYEAKKRNKKVYEVDTTNKKPDQTVKEILKILKGKVKTKEIDWLV